MREISYQNTKLLLFPDYTAETEKQRRLFYAVKAAMRDKGIKYSILFPVKLRVVDGETGWFFTNPRDSTSCPPIHFLCLNLGDRGCVIYLLCVPYWPSGG